MVIDGGPESVVRTVIVEDGVKADGDAAGWDSGSTGTRLRPDQTAELDVEEERRSTVLLIDEFGADGTALLLHSSSTPEAGIACGHAPAARPSRARGGERARQLASARQRASGSMLGSAGASRVGLCGGPLPSEGRGSEERTDAGGKGLGGGAA
jgi:hypothetical protein